MIAVEKGIKIGELSRRCDVVVYTRDIKPFMIIECKEMKVALSEKTLEQILRYHSKLLPNTSLSLMAAIALDLKKR